MDKSINNWHKLDNAAKIFPPNSRGLDTKVFRFSCRLNEAVAIAELKIAAEKTLEMMPSFRCVLRQGLFWYYFEESKFPIEISEESGSPCLPLYFDATSALFKISYFHKSINLEIYHALTDGVGAMQFFENLINNYLFEKYKANLEDNFEIKNNHGSVSQQQSDSFDKYYSGKSNQLIKPKVKKAYQLCGKKLKFYDLSVIEGYCNLNEIANIAKGYGCSITELLCAVMILSVRKTQKVRDKKLPVVVSIPVNLRRFFPSDSVRNFFSVYNVGYELDQSEQDLQSVAESIHNIIFKGLNKDYLQQRLDYLENFENQLYTKLVPLVVKKLILKAAYKRSEKEYTTTVSNLGSIKIDERLSGYVESFSVFNSTRDLQICVCSFNERLCIAFTSRFLSTEIQMEFFRILSSLGIKIKIFSNRWEEENNENMQIL